MDDLLLYGPPGTGKTTAGIHWLGDRIEAGADLYRCAFVSFTNAAVNEAKGRLERRFGVRPDELPFCRTLHALCKRALGISHTGWLADDRLKEFADEFGYDLKPERQRHADAEDLIDRLERTGRDAPFLDVWDFGRQRLITEPLAAWQAFAAYNPADLVFVPRERFVGFAMHYERWKRREALRDMTDLLLEFLAYPVALPVSVAVIDEAQDLSPLMWAVVDRMFAAAEFRAILGDDDQALYCFSGASPELLNGRQARQIIKLTHSYRLAAPTVRAALALIGRNRNREPKDLYPADHAGETGYAHSLSDLDLLSGETWFLQVRNWALFEQLAQQLEGRGIPYLARGGRRHSPWRSETALRAVRALVRLIDRQPVTLTDVWALTRFGHSERGEKAGIWTWGAKSRISERATREPGASVQWHDLGDLGMTPNGVRTLLSHAPFGVLTRELSDRDLAAYTEAWQRGNLSREARVEVGSCHGFKGAEADRQVTVSGCTGRPYRALYDGERVEEERRVAYVALTRARYGSYVLTPRPAPGVYPWEVMRL